MVRCGGVVSVVVCTLAVVVMPDVFVATAVSVFSPSTRGSVARNFPAVTGALTPLIFTVAAGSPTVPVTLIGEMFV